METYSTLYSDQKSFQSFLNTYSIKEDKEYLIRIYTSKMLEEEAVELANYISSLLPKAKIMGASAAGVIFHGTQFDEGTLIMIEHYERVRIQIGHVCWKDKSALETAKEVLQSLTADNTKVMHLVCSDHYYDSHQFVEEFNQLNTEIRLVGGVAGDILSHNLAGYVFTQNGVIKEGIVYAALAGKDFYLYTGVNIAHEAIGPKQKLTNSSGSAWQTINKQAIQPWLKEQLGIETIQQYDDWKIIADNDALIRFPMILENHHGASRFLKYDADTNQIAQYFSQVPTGTEFRIGYVSPNEVLKESFRICNELMDQPVESLFCYSCLFRRLYLHNCAEWEISPYVEANICGAFMMGEIAYIDDRNEFLNGSCCFLGVAEKEVYIHPNIRVFDHLQQIEDDTKGLLNMVLKKQSENISRYNELLLDRLMDQQKQSREQLYRDMNTGFGNYLKFKIDKEQYYYDKLCMFKVDNSDLVISHSGHDHYIQLITDALNQINQFIRENLDEKEMSLYVFNENTYFIAGAKDLQQNEFIDIIKRIFERYRFIAFNEDEDVLINRFVVILEQDEMIEKALNAFQVYKNSQIPFVIYDEDRDLYYSTDEEFRMIGILNWALENDSIIPYFQGIRDNVTNKIIKYEALMRIVDMNGNVYIPSQFMNIAKKYHFYTALSARMIDKVFDLFANKEEAVSINFSYYDISIPEMQKFIFKKLKKVKDASNFVFEILEDEEVRDNELFKHFIKRVRRYGAKIAIDDFGSGYSNLFEIANIQPDYIKVDGSIIRDIHKNETKQKILDIIVYLSQSLELEVVAEFVENKKIQTVIEQKQIRYSQGFYFSKPQPFGTIRDKLTCKGV